MSGNAGRQGVHVVIGKSRGKTSPVLPHTLVRPCLASASGQRQQHLWHSRVSHHALFQDKAPKNCQSPDLPRCCNTVLPLHCQFQLLVWLGEDKVFQVRDLFLCGVHCLVWVFVLAFSLSLSLSFLPWNLHFWSDFSDHFTLAEHGVGRSTVKNLLLLAHYFPGHPFVAV